MDPIRSCGGVGSGDCLVVGVVLLSCLNYPILWVFLVSLSCRVEFQLFSGVSLPLGGFVVFVSIVDVFSFSCVVDSDTEC